jgi:hypothetical protein
MTSRERIQAALTHMVPDKVPVDLGGSSTTGIQAVALHNLRNALGLEKLPVKVWEPMMMLGFVEEDVRKAVGSDVIGINSPVTLLGYKNENWKPWKHSSGIELLMGGGFAWKDGMDGYIYAFPKGNSSVPPSARMPVGGYYFDSIIRQEDLGAHRFDARKDYADHVAVFTDEDCRYYDDVSKKLHGETECALFGNFWQGGVGDIFLIPGPWLERPRGIRDLQEWLIACYDHPDYIKEFFRMQTEICIKNLSLYRQAVGDRIEVIAISGTDFGGQRGPLISLDMYREFYKPCHKVINEWVHKNTGWKVFFHTCGSCVAFLDDFAEVGVDVINPVQFSAAGMDLNTLKQRYGTKFVFWGGGVDSQKTLPFGTPSEVERETRRNVRILSKGGGFVCAAIHNIQGPTPPENIVAFFKAANG